MRLLFVSNYYPPFSFGGYEQWCDEVATELSARGHRVCVLTSKGRNSLKNTYENNVKIFPELHLEVVSDLLNTVTRMITRRKRLETKNLKVLENLVFTFQPDIALLWGMWNVPRSVPARIEQLLPTRVIYYICDYWLALPSAYIQQLKNPSKQRINRLSKKLVTFPLLKYLEQEPHIPLSLKYPICVSHKVRDLLVKSDVEIEHARVIYGGTRVEEFQRALQIRRKKSHDHRKLKLLYAGRITPEKGLHTAILAFRLLPMSESITLDIIGQGEQKYKRELKSLINKYNLCSRVSFIESVPRKDIPTVFVEYDALVFPSEWEEPFARIVLEAMAAGLVVIGTETGGTSEILIEGKTGLVFPAGDSKALANQIMRLKHDDSLKTKLSLTGQDLIAKKFTLSQMVDKIEKVFEKIIGQDQA